MDKETKDLNGEFYDDKDGKCYTKKKEWLIHTPCI